MNTLKTTSRTYTIQLPFSPHVEQVIRQLNQAGAEAYVTGGALRDTLLGKSVVDVDVSTSMRYEVLETFFPPSSVMVVLPRYFCVKLRFQNLFVDVTSYRSEGPYQDHRRPSEVYPATQPEDAVRRDFTMNALYYHPPSATVIDYFDGVRDLLQWGQVRLIRGQESLEEDYLRIFRAIRFSLQCGLSLAPQTLEDLRRTLDHVQSVDADRFRQELQKCLDKASLYEILKLFDRVGLLSIFQVRLLAQRPVYALWQALEGLAPGEAQLKDFLLVMSLWSRQTEFDLALKPWLQCLTIAQKDMRHVHKAYMKLKNPKLPISNFHPPPVYYRLLPYGAWIQKLGVSQRTA